MAKQPGFWDVEELSADGGPLETLAEAMVRDRPEARRPPFAGLRQPRRNGSILTPGTPNANDNRDSGTGSAQKFARTRGLEKALPILVSKVNMGGGFVSSWLAGAIRNARDRLHAR